MHYYIAMLSSAYTVTHFKKKKSAYTVTNLVTWAGLGLGSVPSMSFPLGRALLFFFEKMAEHYLIGENYSTRQNS